MAHKATLKIEGNKNYDVMECEYEFIQPVKENGQPAGHPSCGLIHIVLAASDDNNLFLHDWMQNATKHKDGQVIFEVTGDEKPLVKTLQFKRAYCIRLYEYFNGRIDSQMLTKITISAAEISFGENGNIVFKNDQK